MGEADALQVLHQGVSYQSDEFNRTMSAAERQNATQLSSCRNGHTGRLCQACKDGYTFQGIYCTKCNGTTSSTTKLLVASLLTLLILLIFATWCVRPYFAKVEANIRRMASDQGAKLGSTISRHFKNYRTNLTKDLEMQVRSPRHCIVRWQRHLVLHNHDMSSNAASSPYVAQSPINALRNLSERTGCRCRSLQARRGDLSNATGDVQEGRMSMASGMLGLDTSDGAQATVGSSTDTVFSTIRRLAKVVVSLGQVFSSFSTVYTIPWPKSFATLFNVVGLANLQIFTFPGLACVYMGVDYYQIFLVYFTFPIVLVAYVYFSYRVVLLLMQRKKRYATLDGILMLSRSILRIEI